MKATVEPLEGNKVKLSVKVDEAEFDKAIDAAFRKIAHEVRIPGFRPGKAPRKVLERRLGAEVGREQALQDALPEFYAQAVIDNDVDVIAAPDIDITAGKEEGAVAFDAVVEIRPSVAVPGYGGLQVTIERPVVADDEIDEHIDRMRRVQATLAEVDRPAIDDDVLTIDIAGSLDGDTQEGLTADDYSYTVGSGLLTPEVDDNIRGAKIGDILEFAATHPDPDEERDLQFRILVKQVSERVLPEVDDEWATENSEHDTIAALRDSIRRRSLVLRRAQAQRELQQKASEALSDLVDEEPPQTLVDHSFRHGVEDLAMRLNAQGIDPEQWFAAQAAEQAEDGEGPFDNLRQAAARSVKVDLALRSVAEAEAIECSEEELDAELQNVADRTGQKLKRVREEFERAGQLSEVRSEIRKRKALEWLTEHVVIVDQDGQPIDRDDLVVDIEEFDTPPGDDATADPDAEIDETETETDDMETKEP